MSTNNDSPRKNWIKSNPILAGCGGCLILAMLPIVLTALLCLVSPTFRNGVIEGYNEAKQQDLRSQFSLEELDFLKRCPEVELARIPSERREAFMSTYEELRPRLDGNDVCMLSTEAEIATIKQYEVEVIGEDFQLPDGSTLTPIRLKGAGAKAHKQIVQNFYQNFISSFLAASGQ